MNEPLPPTETGGTAPRPWAWSAHSGRTTIPWGTINVLAIDESGELVVGGCVTTFNYGEASN